MVYVEGNRGLYDEEYGSLLKKSDLNMKSVASKNVEKQSVPLALKVFFRKDAGCSV